MHKAPEDSVTAGDDTRGTGVGKGLRIQQQAPEETPKKKKKKKCC